MDEARLGASAAAAIKPTLVAEPGDTARSLQTGTPPVPGPVTKTTRVVRAADFSSQTYLESEADVEAYVNKLKVELLAAVRSGQKARVQ